MDANTSARGGKERTYLLWIMTSYLSYRGTTAGDAPMPCGATIRLLAAAGEATTVRPVGNAWVGRVSTRGVAVAVAGCAWLSLTR